MSEPVKKKRIRASDLMKDSRYTTEGKYDFRKICQLKGDSGRDVTKKGRPAGVPSSSRSTENLHQMMSKDLLCNVDEDVSTSKSTLEPDQNEVVPGSPEAENNIVMSLQEIYSNLLKEQNGLYCVDDSYLTFALQEFDDKKMILKASKYLIVSRRAMSFMGDVQWVYKCSCDTATSELIECCGIRMNVTFEDFKMRIEDCIHTKTLSAILEQFDAQNQIPPERLIFDELEDDDGPDNVQAAEEDIVELKDGLFVVKSRKGIGIIQKYPDGSKCLTCNSTVVKCIHLNIFLNTFVEQENEIPKKNMTYQQRCFSMARIPFYSSHTMQETYRKALSDRFNLENNIVSFTPEAEVCDVCGIHLSQIEQTSTASVFVMNHNNIKNIVENI